MAENAGQLGFVAEKPGVYFFSLDAGSVAAVGAARTLLNLPYHHASMTVNEGGTPIEYAMCDGTRCNASTASCVSRHSSST